ncbi:MAG: TrbC/VirB2 family protein [Alphaproteobacteria bacterium]|nr:TrbC/VirB2 family protein [Alphaproteobacteria bacterium]
MQFIKNNIWTFCLVAVFSLLTMVGDASAQNSVMELATDKARNVFTSIRTIIFVVGGFGLVGIAFAAIFGKINWKWFAALAVGLAILAAANSIVEYATGDGMGVADKLTSA